MEPSALVRSGEVQDHHDDDSDHHDRQVVYVHNHRINNDIDVTLEGIVTWMCTHIMILLPMRYSGTPGGIDETDVQDIYCLPQVVVWMNVLPKVSFTIWDRNTGDSVSVPVDRNITVGLPLAHRNLGQIL